MVVAVDWSVIYVLVCFLLVFWAARKFLFLPLDKILEERREKIESAQQMASGSDEDVKHKLSEYNARLSEARGAGFEVRQQLKGDAVGREQQIVGEARERAAARMNEAQETLDREIEENKRSLEGETAALAASIADTLLGRRA